ncbi:hypothetical protein, partial [uncultured Megasphaera sp.]|uniref:hypothetical protein n=1 Tax=uncultured Megasphaera sp. TaxID=165188 RepID=UPI0025FB5113
LRPATCGLRPAACDLRPAACDLRPATCGLRPAACDLRGHQAPDSMNGIGLRARQALDSHHQIWYPI